MYFVVCCALRVDACRAVFEVRVLWLLYVVRCLSLVMFGVCCCLLFGVRCVLFVVVAWCLLCGRC